MDIHKWLTRIRLSLSDRRRFRRSCKLFWSKRKIPIYVASVVAAFTLTAILGPALSNAIQVAALTILVVITAEYAASTKRMVDEAKRSRKSLAYRYEKQEEDRARALFRSLLEETRSNSQVWGHYKDMKPGNDARRRSLVRFRVSGKDRLGNIDAVWLSPVDTLPKLREAYFAMECLNSRIDAYYGPLPFALTPGSMGEEYRLGPVLSEVKRIRAEKFPSKDGTFASLLQEVIEEIESDEQDHFQAIRQWRMEDESREEVRS